MTDKKVFIASMIFAMAGAATFGGLFPWLGTLIACGLIYDWFFDN